MANKKKVNVNRIKANVDNLNNLGVEHEVEIHKLRNEAAVYAERLRQREDAIDSDERACAEQTERFRQRMEEIRERRVYDPNLVTSQIISAVNNMAIAHHKAAEALQNITNRNVSAFVRPDCPPQTVNQVPELSKGR